MQSAKLIMGTQYASAQRDWQEIHSEIAVSFLPLWCSVKYTNKHYVLIIYNYYYFVSVPEGDKCESNPCGPNSGCRVVNGLPLCFCLPEYEGNPPSKPCRLPSNPCDPSPCGPNTQCAILSNGFAKCTCLPGFLESPNTIRGCVKMRNPCEPNPCGHGALCDPNREPSCFCPEPSVGNPYRSCGGMWIH